MASIAFLVSMFALNMGHPQQGIYGVIAAAFLQLCALEEILKERR
jgi:hypothetical protein